MSPRPKVIRKISVSSVPEGMLPVNGSVRVAGTLSAEPAELLFEEYEALRLCDYEGFIQQEAASLMGVSRPTLTRIYSSARKKMARALVEQTPLYVRGGSAYRDSGWYVCGTCSLRFNDIRPGHRNLPAVCPICGSPEISVAEETEKPVYIMKKIVLPAREGRIDDHFGHCEYYVIFTVDDSGTVLQREEMPSPQGCGCKSGVAADFQEKGVTVMLAGNMGQGALNKLSSHGIEVIRGCSGKVEDVLKSYLCGNLSDSGIACSHHEEGHECGHHGEGDHKCGRGNDPANPEGWHI